MPSRLGVTVNARLRPLDRGRCYEDLIAGVPAASPRAQRCRVVPLPTTPPSS